MNVISYARSVGSGIVVAENVYFFKFANRHFRDIRAEIVRYSVGIFADKPRRVRPDRIKVTKNRYVKLLVGFGEIFQYIFYKEFGRAVGVGSRKREIFRNRHRVRIAVNRRGRREYEIFTVEFSHYVNQRKHSVDIVFVIFYGFRDRFAYRFITRKVDNRVNLVFGKYFAHRVFIADVVLIKFYFFADDLFNPLNRFEFAVVEIVYDHDVVTCVYKFDRRMAADVTGSARNQNSLHIFFAFFISILYLYAFSYPYGVRNCLFASILREYRDSLR